MRIAKTTGGICAVVLYIQNNTMDVWREYGYVMKLSWMRIVKTTGGMCAVILYIQNDAIDVWREYGGCLRRIHKLKLSWMRIVMDVNCENNRRHVCNGSVYTK